MRGIWLIGWLTITTAMAWGAETGLISEVIYPPRDTGPLRAAPRPQVRATAATTAPVIDGNFDDPCWQAGEWQTGFLLNDESGREAQAQTEFQVAFDPTHVYVAVRCREPQMAQLKSFWGARHDEGIFNDDCVEFWFDVNNLHQRSYHLILSNAGGRWDGVETQQEVDDPQAATVGVKKLVTDTDLQWDTQAVGASQKADDFWTLEMQVLVTDLGVEEILPGSVWGFNLGRERWADGPEFSSLSGVFQFPLDRYAELHFGEPWVKVHLDGTDSLGSGDNRIGLLLENPTPQPQRYTVTLEAVGQRSQRLTRRIRLAAGAKRREVFLCRRRTHPAAVASGGHPLRGDTAMVVDNEDPRPPTGRGLSRPPHRPGRRAAGFRVVPHGEGSAFRAPGSGRGVGALLLHSLRHHPSAFPDHTGR